jgi:hypothetical protein
MANVTKKLLRRLVTEELDRHATDKGYQMMGHALRAAKQFVEGIVEGDRDGALADDLRAKSTEFSAYAKFLAQREAKGAKHFEAVARHVKNIADKSGLLTTLFKGKRLDFKDYMSKELYSARRAFTDYVNDVHVRKALDTVPVARGA